MDTVCPGTSATMFEARKRADGTLLAKCPRCRRVFIPTATGKLRKHGPRSKSSASMDRTMDAIWKYTPAGTMVTQGGTPAWAGARAPGGSEG